MIEALLRALGLQKLLEAPRREVERIDESLPCPYDTWYLGEKK
jgi:hypothetical protein